MVSALITLYKPDLNVRNNVSSICAQVDRVFLCDNSPEPTEKLFVGLKNIHYIFNGANLALSGAFNRALKDPMFTWKNDEFVIFFDQDSSVKPGHVQGLIEEYESLSTRGYKIGCLGPVYYNHSIDRIAIPRSKKDISEDSFIVKSIITSSMLCRYENLRDIQFWNEKVFLDLSDWDLCWRFMQHGKVCVETRKVVLDHTVGTGYKKVGPIGIAISSQVREYYQTRNYLYLLHMVYVPLKYKIEFIQNLTVRPLIHRLFLEDGKERMKFVKAGRRDYKKGYFGEYPYKSNSTNANTLISEKHEEHT